MRRIDISMPLRPGMPTFPGDPPFGTEPTHSIGRGDPYNHSRLTLGSHAGTHIDPPAHFIPNSEGTDKVDLDLLNGPCQVVGIDPSRREISEADLPNFPTEPRRVLLRTANSDRWARSDEFFSDYVALTISGAEKLLSLGARLVGIDSLSIESDPHGRYPVHHLLLRGGAVILEGLRLADATPGTYELECLPLRLAGGDGGPARAVLRTQ